MGWEPVIIAAFACIGTAFTALPTLVVALGNRRKLGEVHEHTNGGMVALRQEVAALRAEMVEASLISTTPATHQ